MSNDEIIRRLDLGVVDDLDQLADLLRERRHDHLVALAALDRDHLGLAERLVVALRETRQAEIAIAEEVLAGLGEPLELPEVE